MKDLSTPRSTEKSLVNFAKDATITTAMEKVLQVSAKQLQCTKQCRREN